MLMLDVEVGEEQQRVCVATTHIPCGDSQGGLRKMGQVMALISAAIAEFRKHPSMVFILTGDFNAHLGEFLIEYLMSGSVDLAQMPKKKPRPFKLTGPILKDFKVQTWALRDVLKASSSVSRAEKPRERKRRICVTTTHIVCDDSQVYNRLGQIMALISAANVQLKKDSSMPFVLAGDFNASPRSQLTNYILSGSADLTRMPKGTSKRAKRLHTMLCQPDQNKSANFKYDTRALRGIVLPSTAAGNAEDPSEQKSRPKDDELRALIPTQNKNQQQQQTAGKAAHPAQHSSEQTSSHGKNAAHGANAQSTHKAGADKQQQSSGANANDRAEANKQHHNQNKKSSGSHPQKVDGRH
ncbi:hypothetical protein BGZ72_002084 [Mortierella alpina]|nr:hypothetical protein BGZ72_002084 [Mortierella alpina]